MITRRGNIAKMLQSDLLSLPLMIWLDYAAAIFANIGPGHSFLQEGEVLMLEGW